MFKNGAAPHINNIQLGKYGRNRTNVWRYPGANSFAAGRDKRLAAHPTVKPVAMIADAILDCSNRDAIVLDPFVGSGSTLLAAARTGRRGYGIELDPLYVDAALQRLARTIDEPIIHVQSGLTYEALAAKRKQVATAKTSEEAVA